MKRLSLFLLMVLLAIFMIGMGNLTGKPGGSIPLPDKDFKATITDVNSVKTTCSYFSINGKDYLKGMRGAATVTIPFEKIAVIKIRIFGDEKDVEAEVMLLDDQNITLYVDSNSDIYGKTDFGTVQIKMRDITTIEFSNEEK